MDMMGVTHLSNVYKCGSNFDKSYMTPNRKLRGFSTEQTTSYLARQTMLPVYCRDLTNRVGARTLSRDGSENENRHTKHVTRSKVLRH